MITVRNSGVEYQEAERVSTFIRELSARNPEAAIETGASISISFARLPLITELTTDTRGMVPVPGLMNRAGPERKLYSHRLLIVQWMKS